MHFGVCVCAPITTDPVLQPSQSPFEQYEDDITEEMSRPSTANFNWPPPQEYTHDAPTASPLYIPPPGTQHVKVKTLNSTDLEENVAPAWLKQQSRSAPELTDVQQHMQQHDSNAEAANESSSESYTSTCTTTTTTSEQYHKMYHAQSGAATHYAYAMAGDHSDNEYGADMEMSMMHQQNQPYNYSFSSGSTDLMSFSGRRSVQECTDALTSTMDTCQLVHYLKELTPAPEMPPIKPGKHVEFAEPIKHSDPPYTIPASPKPLPQSNIPNPMPKEWISQMTMALTTASEEPFHIANAPAIESDAGECFGCDNEACEDCDAQCKEICQQLCAEENRRAEINYQHNAEPIELPYQNTEPPKGSSLTSCLTTASPYPVEWTKPVDETIPLPDETEPYVPSAISMTPYEKEDFGHKSTFVDALTTAPFRSFTPFDHDVITQLEDLPTPSKELKLIDALTVAPSDPYHELNTVPEAIKVVERAAAAEEKRREELAVEVNRIISNTIETHMDHQISAFAKISGFRSVNPFKPKSDPIPPAPEPAVVNEQRRESVCAAGQTQTIACSNKGIDQSHQVISFPPPPGVKCKSYVQSGLHKPGTIPKYQRQWFNLPSQSPVRTPEPPELKENVPLAFVDSGHQPDTSDHEHDADNESSPIVKVPAQDAPLPIYSVEPTPTVVAPPPQLPPKPIAKPVNVPIIVEERVGSISMPFQPFEPEPLSDQSRRSVSPYRPHTPSSSLINKPAPAVPYYQLPENLVALECPPSPCHLFDPHSDRSQSPFPDRARSPAPGPPPNPLRIHAPRLRDPSQDHQLTQSAIDSLSQLDACQFSKCAVSQSSGQVLSHYQTVSQSGAQSFVDKPEVVQQRQVGNMNIQTRSKESALNEEKRSDFQSASVTQIGNTQVQRKTRVVEEFEHTQKAKTVEIYKSSTGAQGVRMVGGTVPSITNFSANHAAKQSANDAVVATVSAATAPVCETKQCTDDRAAIKEGFVAQQTRRLSTNSQYAADMVTYQSKFPQITNAPPATSSFPIKSFSPIREEPKAPTYNPIKSKPSPIKQSAGLPPPGYQPLVNVTKPAAQAAATITQSYNRAQSFNNTSAASSFASTLTSSTTATKPQHHQQPTPQQQQQPPLPPTQSSFKLPTAIPVPAFKPPLSTANDFKPSQTAPQYKPTASSGPGFKPPSITTPSAVVSDPSPASAGPNKGLTFGATSAPRRGRGVLNKAGVGGRIPQCGCCNAQIR